jgi:hypothetical protein
MKAKWEKQIHPAEQPAEKTLEMPARSKLCAYSLSSKATHDMSKSLMDISSTVIRSVIKSTAKERTLSLYSHQEKFDQLESRNASPENVDE